MNFEELKFNKRRSSRLVKVGSVDVGGDSLVSVQTMLSVNSHDFDGCVRQALEVEEAGCDILRVAIPDNDSVQLIPRLKSEVKMPIVADIHFDYRLALAAIEVGVDKIRLNPGNIGGEDKVFEVVKACKAHGVPIRIGVNGGSLEKSILEKHGAPTPEALCESALYHASLLEKFEFNDIILSLKSSDVPTMIAAYQLISERCDYPLHLGVTEAGTFRAGLVKSSIGIGSLLLDGIGDTIRVSLTDSPVNEVKAGLDILKTLELKKSGAVLVSCPTCGRTEIALTQLAKQVEELIDKIDKPITVAVMGCIVNGPGEASRADVGIAGGKGKVVLFKKGVVVETVREEDALNALKKIIDQL